MEKIEGIITCGDKGKFTVFAENNIIICNAKGIFRNQDISPMAGDRVMVVIDNDSTNLGDIKGTIDEIMPRKNEFVRPKMTNLDTLFIVTSICEPSPNLLIIDKLIAICRYKEVTPVVVITKTDLASFEHIQKIYQNSNIQTISLSNKTLENVDKIYDLIRDKTVAFVGNTGVGKSSLINALFPTFNLETAKISKKLGRGKHTTRTVTLYKIEEYSCFLADTPGFGAVETNQYDIIVKEELQYCFDEFTKYLHSCKFGGCSHTCEKGCTILKACEDGLIERTRMDSYISMYNDAKNIKEWENKN